MLGCTGFLLLDEPCDPSESSIEVRILTRDKGGEVWMSTNNSSLHSVSFLCVLCVTSFILLEVKIYG